MGLEDRLRDHVRILAGDIGERNFLEPARLERAALHVETILRESGYDVRRQGFRAGGQDFRNLLADRPASLTGSGGVVLVGAHYDAAPGTPGADDNASGVAVLLELARLARALPGSRILRFAAFANEEPPFFGTQDMGSAFYVREALRSDERVEAMVCLEMLGFYDGREGSQAYPPFLRFFFPSRGDFIAAVSNLRSKPLLRTVAGVLREHGEVPVVSASLPAFVPGVDFSDHRNFWEAGWPAVMLTDTSFYRYPHYHEPTDTPERLDYPRMAGLTRGLLKLLDRLAGAAAVTAK